jgi:MFS family permease
MFAHPMAPRLVLIFVGANFAAMVFLTWLPSYLSRRFGMNLALAGFSSTAYLQIASVLGVTTGGVMADRWQGRSRGGRMRTQALGLIAGAPFLFLSGWTLSAPLLVLALVGFGYFKGFYDANIWASLYDVVPVSRRATALGIMNSIGWLGGGVAPVAIAAASERLGMGTCLSATSLIYLGLGAFMIIGVRLYMHAPGSEEQVVSVISAER